MEVMMIQHNAPDFDFPSSATASPCSSTPQSPARYFFSAPSSPARLSDFYRQFDNFSLGAPKPTAAAAAEKELLDDDDDDDFAFDFSEDLERASLSADELFDGGVIKPVVTIINPPQYPRGRDHTRSFVSDPNVSRSSRRATRSLSPVRESSQLHFSYKQQEHDSSRRRGGNNTIQRLTEQQKQRHHHPVPKPPSASASSSASKKWRLRDFLLFRSASEGRAAERDPLRKYYYNKYNRGGSTSGGYRIDGGSESGRVRRGGEGPGAMSAHGRHYTANKAVSEDLKKKTFLPYKQGILGRLSFNPALHALANGFGSLTRA